MSEQGQNALKALQRHVYRTDGGGHGDEGELPDELSEEELQRYVHPVDE